MSESFRVAHVNVTRGYRGGERQTELLIRELAGHGVPQVLVGRRHQPLPRRVTELGIEIRLTSGNPITVFAATKGVDLVHVHEGRSVYSAYLRAVVSGTPYILTRRVDNPIRDHRFSHRAYRRAYRVACITPAVERAVETFDPEIRTTVISSSSTGFVIDAEAAARIRARYAGRFLVGHVGALDNSAKGQEHIIAAARTFAVSDPDIAFLLVGGGRDEAMLRSMAAGLPNVEFEGFVDNVGDYLAAFDVFILPSNREGLGSILLDAMDQRLPIIASNVGGIPSIVHDGTTGLLIEPGRADLIVAAIRELRADGAQRRALGEAAFELASTLKPPVMCRSYLDLYREALEAARA